MDGFRVLLVCHDTDGRISWEIYEWGTDDLDTAVRGHLNTPGVAKLELFPESSGADLPGRRERFSGVMVAHLASMRAGVRHLEQSLRLSRLPRQSQAGPSTGGEDGRRFRAAGRHVL
jgi:hypothetical protein